MADPAGACRTPLLKSESNRNRTSVRLRSQPETRQRNGVRRFFQAMGFNGFISNSLLLGALLRTVGGRGGFIGGAGLAALGAVPGLGGRGFQNWVSRRFAAFTQLQKLHPNTVSRFGCFSFRHPANSRLVNADTFRNLILRNAS